LAHFETTVDPSAAHGAHIAVAPNLQWYRAALLIVIACCTYLHVPLLSGGRLLVPSFPTVVLAPILLLTVWRSISKADELFLPKVAFVMLLSIGLSPGYEHVGQKLFGLVQLAMALGVAILVVRLMQQIRRPLLERALLLIWCLIIAGSILEVTGVIRDASDAFRQWAYAGAFTLYDSTLRDMNMVGWPRPKLFSVEPSHVTKFFTASVNAWLLVRVSWAKVAVAAGATLAMLVIMGSPSLLASAAITVAIVVWDRGASLRAKVMMVIGGLLIGAVLAVYFGGAAYSSIEGRLTSLGETSSQRRNDPTSEDQRMVYPYMTLAGTWLRWPLFGVGITGKEVVAETTTLSLRNPEIALGNNAMAEFGTYLGLVGGALFVYLLLSQVNQTGVKRLGLIVAMIAVFSQLMGGMESFRYWGFIALLWGGLAVADTQPKRAQGLRAPAPRGK
jgi:hypothetical protein